MLKTLLQTLVESVFSSKREWLGNQSMPSDSGIQYPASTASPFVAPSDGYLTLGAQPLDGSPYVNMWTSSTGLRSAGCGFQSPTRDARAFIPCKKGQYVWFATDGMVDAIVFTTINGTN